MPSARELFGRGGDLVLAAAVTLGVCLLVVKVPTSVMDVLLATNLAIAAVVLLAALFVPDARRLPAFPTILLLTTLFRLALNVSSTRLILLDADAGRVIESFGRVVVGGDVIVGGVIFVVLVVVQFVVIARGSERVAEVAARFTLDAMPGKQASIDAEVRSGLLSPEEARERRGELERESRLYGAMDGAMKFVKGDAVAGLVISVVNIGAGLLLGVMQRGLSAADAARTYGLLTIGDGLCAQIPSILTSVAAGLVVTRVASAEGTPVGSDLARQFLLQPRVTAIVGVLLLGLGLLPLGFPPSPFLLTGAACLTASLVSWRVVTRQAAAASRRASDRAGDPAPTCVLRVHPDLLSRLDAATLAATAAGVAESVGKDLGIRVPPTGVASTATGVEPMGYAVELLEAPVAVRRVNAEGDAASEMATTLERALRDHAPRLLGIGAVHTMLEGLRTTEEGRQLVRSVTPSPLSLQQVAEVLQRLVRENVPLRPLPLILESMARWGQTTRNPQYLTERVRKDLAPTIAARFSSSPGRVTFLAVDPDLEDLVEASVEDLPEGQVVGMSDEDRARVIAACEAAAAKSPASVLVVEHAPVRRPLRSIIERQLPHVAVMSYDELPREVAVKNAGTVSLTERP
ncbi:MAG: hypothetical protein RL689_768 [Planctomycetota bacterium]|jgi:type III secretion protein V